MGKEKPGFLSAKAISNRIKSKGLQKLRWFCQMCQKQCRDENGFKCHIMSETHHRQMLLFDENPDRFVGNFTSQFMKGYLDILKRQFGGKRTNANFIYQEYIKNKEHVHMNSTKFTTLTGFINCLHKMGICKVDESEKGWFIEYIDKNPEAEYNEKKKQKLKKEEDDDEKNFLKLFEKNERHSNELQKPSTSELIRTTADEAISIKINAKTNPTMSSASCSMEAVFELDCVEEPGSDDEKEAITTTADIDKVALSRKRKLPEGRGADERPPQKQQHREIKHLSVLDELMRENELEKDRTSRRRNWLCEGIVVKLIGADLPNELCQQEAVVRQLESPFTAIVKTVALSGSQKKLRAQQDGLMTVVPRVGQTAMIVNGAYRGTTAVLTALDRSAMTATLRCTSGIYTNQLIRAVALDDFSKLHQQ